MKSGIYAIYNSKSGKAYIGQSKDVNRRINDHKRCLEKGTHHNKYLQRAYNHDGAENFHFIIMEYCSIDDLDRLEREYIERMQLMDSGLGYNLENGGNVGKEVSERAREAKRGKNNPMYGKHPSINQIETVRIRNRGHGSSLNEQQVAEIKEALFNESLSCQELADKYGVNKHVICKIKTGKNWYWVRDDLNKFITDEYKKSERDKKIRQMEADGYSRASIAKALGISAGTVQRVMNEKSPYMKDSPEKKKKINEVVKDFKDGLSKEEIMQKHGITSCVYVAWTHDAYNERQEAIKQRAIEMRRSGMMVKDIAKELGYVRTTISRWTECVKRTP